MDAKSIKAHELHSSISRLKASLESQEFLGIPDISQHPNLQRLLALSAFVTDTLERVFAELVDKRTLDQVKSQIDNISNAVEQAIRERSSSALSVDPHISAALANLKELPLTQPISDVTVIPPESNRGFE